MNNYRYAVIMAGGHGERFWPVSTQVRPKQFLQIFHEKQSLLQESYSRINQLIEEKNIFVATSPNFKEIVAEQLPNLSIQNILCEPYKRNTLGCLLWSVAHIIAQNSKDWEKISLAILTSDHYITPSKNFCQLIDEILTFCEKNDSLLTIGITPTRPETGYGYIEIDNDINTAESVTKVKQFREKPDYSTALEFLNSNHFLWNSGMFFWKLSSFVNTLKTVCPLQYQQLFELSEYIQNNEIEEAKELFSKIEDISIDYALLEKAKNVYVAKANFMWDDVGSWEALSRLKPKDSNNNVVNNNYLLLESSNCTVHNELENTKICLMGIEDLIVVATEEAILICQKDRAQDIKRIKSLHDSKFINN